MEKLVIRSKDIIHNINTIKQHIQKNCNLNETKIPKIIGVVKGNGYGLGLIELSNLLINNGIDMLAVAKVNDCVLLRKSGIKQDILLLSSTCVEQNIFDVINNDIIPTIGSIESLIKYNKVATQLNKKINVHIKVETGFGRYGVKINEIAKFIEEYNECENINIVGMFTHFSSAFSKDTKNTDNQFIEFTNIVKIFELNNIKIQMLHVCNSTATFKYPKYYLDAVRLGSAIIGRLPIPYKYGLKKPEYFQTSIVEIRQLDKGKNIGYGNRYKLKKNSKIGICQVGYVEGIGLEVKSNVYTMFDILRNIKHYLTYIFKKPKKYVLINNEKYEIISNIGMSNIIIDISNSDIKVGDTVEIDVNPILIDSNIQREYI